MTETRKLAKVAMRQRGRELRALLNDWDPIGILGPDAPPGDTEYDDLLWPVMRLLEKGATAEDLAEFLRRKLDDDYGVTTSASAVAHVAKQIRDWFATGRANTIV